jgi:predicted DNA-binding transcriptional regulator YafY
VRWDTCQRHVRIEAGASSEAKTALEAGRFPVNPIERALSLLLLLSRRKLLSATELSRRFDVSVRTIYRDIDRLIALGVPVEAERGAEGGFRLSDEFLSPPISLNRVETTALLVALSLMRGLRATPLRQNLESAEAKLLAALPQAAREILANGASIVGIEQAPDDIFHGALPAERIADQHKAVDRFLDGILMHRRVDLVHRGSTGEKLHEVEPHGLLFDRSLWYLVGRSLAAAEIRMWRADRVASINVTGFAFRPMPDFDIRSMLGRQWLEQAMRTWDKDREGARIRLAAAAAERLRREWYYRHAAFTPHGDGFVMSLPDADPRTVLPLLRWLGTEAEILSPERLREALRAELEAMARGLEVSAEIDETPASTVRGLSSP